MAKKELKRFHRAQQWKGQESCSLYDKAYAEIQAGQKVSHWIWFIFPQLRALGMSKNAIYFGISDLAEACDYLEAPLLFEHYLAMVTLVQTKLREGVPIITLMGGGIDAKKICSSLTLYRAAALHLISEKEGLLADQFRALAQCCDDLLQQLSECSATLEYIGAAMPKKETPPAPEAEIKPLPAPADQRISQAVVLELDRYIEQCAKEPGYWFQGLFKGLSKVDKLTAALGLRLTLMDTIEDHTDLARIIKTYGLDIEQLRGRDCQHDLAMLCQGQLRERLITIVREEHPSDGFQSLPGAAKAAAKPRTVEDLIRYLLAKRPPVDKTPNPN